MKRLGIALALLLLQGCGDDVPTSREKLQNAESPLVRAGAAQRLGELGGAEALRLLTTHGLRDSDGSVRAASVRALALEPNPRVVDLFADLLGDPDPSVQRAAAESLSRQSSDKSRRYLEVHYARVGQSARMAIGEVLVGAGGSPERAVEEAARRSLDRNLEALRNGAQAERIGAAEELGRSGKPEAVASLLPLLASRSVPLAAAAARALGTAQAERAVEPLIRILAEPYPELQQAAATALGHLGDPSAVPALEKAAATVGPAAAPEVLEALASLARSGAPDAAQALCRVTVGAGSPEVARTAAEVLLGLGATCEIAPQLGEILARSGDVLSALTVAEVLGAPVLDDAGRKGVATFTAASDPLVRAAAWRAAASAGLASVGAAALDELERLVAIDRSGRQEWVADALPTTPGWGNVGSEEDPEEDPGALDPLQGMGKKNEARYRQRFGSLMEQLAAARAQRKVGGAEDSPELAAETARHLDALTREPVAARVEVVEDLPSHLDVRLAAAALAAGRLVGEPALPLLRGLLEHPVALVQQAAVQGLARIPGRAAGEALTSVLTGDASAEAVARAAEALGERREGEGALIDAAVGSPAPAQPAIARALARIGGEAPRPALEALLQTSAAPEAVAGLVGLGGEASIAALVAHLEGSALAGRAEALEGLMALEAESPGVREAARRSLHAERPAERAAALRVLIRLGASDPWMGALANDYDRSVRAAAVKGANQN